MARSNTHAPAEQARRSTPTKAAVRIGKVLLGGVFLLAGCDLVLGIDPGHSICEGREDGELIAEQTVGDCVDVVCDGDGRTRLEPNVSDLPNDNNPCTKDGCSAGAPTHEPILTGFFPCYGGPEGTLEVGMCKSGSVECQDGQAITGCEGQILPVDETCVTPGDDNCNGESNEGGEGCLCEKGQIQSCYTGPTGTRGVGECKDGTQICASDGVSFEPCVDDALPGEEICDAGEKDEDCDGQVNEEGSGCFCGDGYFSPGAGEDCDDGNGSDDDACTQSCFEQKAHQLAVGEAFTCARLSRGFVKCWGAGLGGWLGLEDTNTRGDQPNEMGSFLPIVKLGQNKKALHIASWLHTCAVFADGSLKCWGSNELGQLGLGDTNPRGTAVGSMGDSLPVVNLGINVTSVAVGATHTCALLELGTVKCWGNGQFGQTGLGTTLVIGDQPGEIDSDLAEVDLGVGTTVVALSAGYGHTCALLSDGKVKCFGWNFYGQLGQESLENLGDESGEMGGNLAPINLGTNQVAVAISTGFAHSCALLATGKVKCWGLNTAGQLGQGNGFNKGSVPGDMGDNLPPIDLGVGKKAVAISCGAAYTCAVLEDGNIKCWGFNDDGELGLGDTMGRGKLAGQMGDNLPTVDLGAGKTAQAISAGGLHTCAVLTDGSIKCWGRNKEGQLGLESTIGHGDGTGPMGDGLPISRMWTSAW